MSLAFKIVTKKSMTRRKTPGLDNPDRVKYIVRSFFPQVESFERQDRSSCMIRCKELFTLEELMGLAFEKAGPQRTPSRLWWKLPLKQEEELLSVRDRRLCSGERLQMATAKTIQCTEGSHRYWRKIRTRRHMADEVAWHREQTGRWTYRLIPKLDR